MTTIGSTTTGSLEPRDDRSTLTVFAALTSVAAFLLAALGLVAVVAKGGSSSASSASSEPVAVTLSEFKISPATISASAGNVKLKISNAGSVAHNVSIAALGKKSSDIAGGASETLDLGDVKEGTYEVICTIAGHAESGMKGTLVVGGSGSSSAAASGGDSGGHGGHSDAEYGDMDAKMQEGMAKGVETFVKGGATKGQGNQRLEPVAIEADGTKVFKLEAAIIDWEVAPGKTVKAWAYNNQVPGPWIRTEPNDKVKVEFTNKLPVSSDIHWHGVSTPFKMDGVAPITQDVVKPGQTFTYSWTNRSFAELGMYHAHNHGQEAVVNGMFAVFQVGDVPMPAAGRIGPLDVPAISKPTYEKAMVLNDAGVIGLTLNGKAYPATEALTMNPGETMLMHYYNEGLQIHPMHLHHVYQLVIAKDGIPLTNPYWVDTLNVAPGERYSVLIMPKAEDVGIWAYHCHILNHAEGPDGLMGMVTALIVNDPNAKK